jgi:hemerythrin-like domain-containing protein
LPVLMTRTASLGYHRRTYLRTKDTPMMPIGPLMIEHRWIERVIAGIRRTLLRAEQGEAVDPGYVGSAVDFIRTYADRCHHGKEEDILFRDLADKELTPELTATMRELVAEHEWARGIVRQVTAANLAASEGDPAAAAELARLLAELAAFYPVHIKKEDDRFFRLAMALFDPQEQAAMLTAFSAFDASLIHEKYRAIAQELEAGGAPKSR